MSHLNALQVRLSNERNYLAKVKTESERELRRVWIAQIEKEIADEMAFLNRTADTTDLPDMSDDELLSALLD